MNLRFLETFLWIARLGSFRAAAGKLNLTQAAASGRIASLENDPGLPLFERGSRAMRLTPAGRALIRCAEQIMAADQAMREALKGPRTVQGRIRLGIVESIVHTWFAPFMTRLHDTYPHLEIELTVESTLRLRDLIKRGAIDVALQPDPAVGAFAHGFYWRAKRRSGRNHHVGADCASLAHRDISTALATAHLVAGSHRTRRGVHAPHSLCVVHCGQHSVDR